MGEDVQNGLTLFPCVVLSLGPPAPPTQRLLLGVGGQVPAYSRTIWGSNSYQDISWGPGSFSKEGTPPSPPYLVHLCQPG